MEFANFDYNQHIDSARFTHYSSSVIFVNENENGEKPENNEFVNEN